ncbi:MAG: DUF4363 family protein [Oscillospiraceae bacterium]|nr:DUF4363 family protein [Oscillospiraceae bacterium]
MRRIVICIILALVILAGGICGVIYTTGFSDGLLTEVEAVAENFERGDIEAAKQAFSRVKTSWDGFRDFHILVSDQEHALEITMCITRMESLLEQEEDDLLTECATAAKLIEVFRHEQLPNITNIL